MYKGFMKKQEKDTLKKCKNLIQIGFVLQDLGPNQLAYTCISSINKYLDNNYGIDPVLFFQEQSMPCLQPKCARYNVYDTSYYYGNLITTTIDTTVNTRNARVCQKFYYIYELEYLKNKENKVKFDTIMNDNTIVKFTRCLDFLQQLRNDGYEINGTIVNDFDPTSIHNIIKGTQ